MVISNNKAIYILYLFLTLIIKYSKQIFHECKIAKGVCVSVKNMHMYMIYALFFDIFTKKNIYITTQLYRTQCNILYYND